MSDITSTRVETSALEKLKTIARVTGRSMTKSLTKMIDREFEDVTGITFARQKEYIDYVAKHGHPPDNEGYVWDDKTQRFLPRK